MRAGSRLGRELGARGGSCELRFGGAEGRPFIIARCSLGLFSVGNRRPDLV
jgi:hypothetical protein